MAFSGMAGAAICELAGTRDIDAIWEDFQESVDELRPLYPDQIELCDRAVEVWIEVLKFFGTPRVGGPPRPLPRGSSRTVPSGAFRRTASGRTIRRSRVLRKPLRPRLVLPARGSILTGWMAIAN